MAHPRPEGRFIDDQRSMLSESILIGGQLITGYDVFPDSTGPSPLLLIVLNK